MRKLLLNEFIDSLLLNDKRTIIAIDGIGTSGKSTLTNKIKDLYQNQCSVFHIDDFFLPFHKRSDERMKTVFGNVDWERFEVEVLRNLDQKTLEVAKYSCTLDKMMDIEEITLGDIIIVEGVSSARKEWKDYYDYILYIDIEPSVRIERIEIRDGEEKLETWISKWIPIEDQYMKEHNPKSYADFIIDGTFSGSNYITIK